MMSALCRTGERARMKPVVYRAGEMGSPRGLFFAARPDCGCPATLVSIRQPCKSWRPTIYAGLACARHDVASPGAMASGPDYEPGNCPASLFLRDLNMKCPTCGAAGLTLDTRDLVYMHHGQRVVIPAVTAEFCAACDESITDLAETDRVMRAMRHFNAQVELAKPTR